MEAALEEHVEELRKRVFYSLVCLLAASILGYYFSSEILSWMQTDLEFTFHALTAYEVFYTQLSISIIVGLALSFPFLFYQILRFVRPGLKPREYRILVSYLPFSFVLFALGILFGYQVVVKSALTFFQAVTQGSEVAAVWGLKSTLGFALKLSFLTGIVFQIPAASLILAKAGILRSEMMKNYRAYFWVFGLFLAAVASPPDILSQLMIFFPVIALYEVSIRIVGLAE